MSREEERRQGGQTMVVAAAVALGKCRQLALRLTLSSIALLSWTSGAHCQSCPFLSFSFGSGSSSFPIVSPGEWRRRKRIPHSFTVDDRGIERRK